MGVVGPVGGGSLGTPHWKIAGLFLCERSFLPPDFPVPLSVLFQPPSEMRTHSSCPPSPCWQLSPPSTLGSVVKVPGEDSALFPQWLVGREGAAALDR